jgi:hypothetical protein
MNNDYYNAQQTQQYYPPQGTLSKSQCMSYGILLLRRTSPRARRILSTAATTDVWWPAIRRPATIWWSVPASAATSNGLCVRTSVLAIPFTDVPPRLVANSLRSSKVAGEEAVVRV